MNRVLLWQCFRYVTSYYYEPDLLVFLPSPLPPPSLLPPSPFAQVSYWVASEICTVKDPKSRAALIEKFIEIAKVQFHHTIVMHPLIDCLCVRSCVAMSGTQELQYNHISRIRIIASSCQTSEEELGGVQCLVDVAQWLSIRLLTYYPLVLIRLPPLCFFCFNAPMLILHLYIRRSLPSVRQFF